MRGGHTLCAQAPAASPESLRAAHRDTQTGPKAGGPALLPPLLRGHLVSQVTQREQGKLLAFSALAFLWLTPTGPQAWQLSWAPLGGTCCSCPQVTTCHSLMVSCPLPSHPDLWSGDTTPRTVWELFFCFPACCPCPILRLELSGSQDCFLVLLRPVSSRDPQWLFAEGAGEGWREADGLGEGLPP